jgi:hypothetical protein
LKNRLSVSNAEPNFNEVKASFRPWQNPTLGDTMLKHALDQGGPAMAAGFEQENFCLSLRPENAKILSDRVSKQNVIEFDAYHAIAK